MIPWREWTLHVLALSVFVESVQIGPARIGRVLAVLAALAVVLVLISRPASRVLPPGVIGVPVALLTLWSYLSVFWSTSLTGWLNAQLQLALALCYFAAFVVLPVSRAQVERVLRSFAVGAVAAGLLGLTQASPEVRAVGLQGDANMFALYEAAAVPIALHQAFRSTGRMRSLWLFAAIAMIAGVVASQSRGGVLTVVTVVVVLLWRGDLGERAARFRISLTTAGAVLSLLVFAVLVSLLPRFSFAEAKESGGTGRVDIWRAALTAWEQTPLVGIGAGQWEVSSSRFLSTTPGVMIDPYSIIVLDGIRIHSAYIEPLVELGPVGLVLYLALLLGVAVVLMTETRHARGGLTRALMPMLVAFVSATVFLSAMNNKLLWIVAGLAAAVPYLPDRFGMPDAVYARGGDLHHELERL